MHTAIKNSIHCKCSNWLCIVFAGYNFDLSNLKKTGTEEPYKISTKDYNYFINVCGPLTKSPCGESGQKNAGVCQQRKDTPS